VTDGPEAKNDITDINLWKSGKSSAPAKYFGDMVTYMDKIVGRIAAKLDALGVRDNTLILFIGDNGTDNPVISIMGGRKVAGGKRLMTDAGTNATNSTAQGNFTTSATMSWRSSPSRSSLRKLKKLAQSFKRSLIPTRMRAPLLSQPKGSKRQRRRNRI
jgi:arylsulfatase A-like enzyme